MCDNKKRPVYSETEKILLKELVLKYSDIIENKNTDSNSNKRKSQAWEKISEEYNQCSNINQKATVKQLQSLWENIKHRQREILVAEKQYRHRSGGAQGQPDVPIDPLVANAVPHLIVEIPNVIDCDISDKEIMNDETVNDEFSKKNDASISTIITIDTPQYMDCKKRDVENNDSIKAKRLCLEREDVDTKLINDSGDKILTPSSSGTRTKWSSQNLSSQSSRSKGHDIRTEAVQNEANARLDRYTQLSKNEYEIHALNMEVARYKVMAEKYRAENERKQLEIIELSKKLLK